MRLGDAWGPALIFLTICFGHDARATLPIFFASVLLSLFPGFGASVQIRSRLHQEECRVHGGSDLQRRQGMYPQPQTGVSEHR